MTNDTMTVKELAEVAGVSPKTIYRAVKKLHYDIHRGVEAKFDHEQCLRIVGVITAGQKNGHLSKAHRTPVHSSRLQIGEVQPEIVKAFSDALQIMNKLAAECAESNAMTRRLLEKLETRPALPAPDMPEYVTIAGYCNLKNIHLAPEAILRAGRIASAIANDRGVAIGKAPHERWGYVNTYPLSICAEAIAA